MNDQPKININDYQSLIFLITNKFNPKYRGELYNECYLQLHQLALKYTPSKGTFQTYAYKRLYYTCIDFIRANTLNHQSLDEVLYNEDNSVISRVDLLESEEALEDDIINSDYFKKYNEQLTDIQKFIQDKYYYQGMSVEEIITVYQDFHQIKSKKTIYKILKR